MKNKLWLFGDSFTAGTGLSTSNSEERSKLFYYEDQYTGLDFGTILGERLNIDVVNKGLEGGSNRTIIDSVIDELHRITPEDIVIIGQTEPSREQLICNVKEIPEAYTQYQITPWMIEQLLNSSEESKWLKGITDDTKMKESIIDYYLNVICQQNESRDNYYHKRYVSLVKYFNSVNIRALHWSYKIWDYLENIEVWTDGHPNGKVDDGHWSPNGCAGFAYILEFILTYKPKIEEITIDTLLKEDKLLHRFHKQHTYIPFTPFT